MTIIALHQTRILLFHYVSIWGVQGEDCKCMPVMHPDFKQRGAALVLLLKPECLIRQAKCVFLWVVGLWWSSSKGRDHVQVMQCRLQKYNNTGLWCSLCLVLSTCVHMDRDHLPLQNPFPQLSGSALLCSFSLSSVFCSPWKLIFSFFPCPEELAEE